MASGGGRKAGVQRQEEGDVVAGVVVADGDGDLRLAAAPAPPAAPAPRRPARRPGCGGAPPPTAAARSTASTGSAAGRLGRAGPLGVGLERREPLRELVPHGEQVGEAGPRAGGVATPQVGQLGAAGLHRGQALGVALDRLRRRAQVVGHVVELGGDGPQAVDGRVRTAPARRAPPGPRRPGRGPLARCPGRPPPRPAAARWASASARSDSSAASRSSSSASVSPTRSISSSWKRRKSISRSRAPASPPSAAEHGVRLARLPRGSPRGRRRSTPAKRSRARRWLAVVSSPTWACWPWRSTSAAASSASSAAVISRPSR